MSTSTSSPTPPSLVSLSRGGVTNAPPVPKPARRWKTRVLVPAFILLAVAAVLLYAARDVLVPAIEVRVVPVVMRAGPAAPDQSAAPTQPKSSGPGTALVQAPGWIEPSPFAYSVPALVEGVVSEILVLEGERVEAGQVVARLINTDLVLEEESAAATVAERDADVHRAEAATAQARAQVEVNKAAAAAARDEVTGKRELVEGGGVSAGQFRRMEIRLQGLEAEVSASEYAIAEAEAAVAQAKAARDSAHVRLKHARLRRERADIRSPYAGVVLTRQAKPGMRLAMGGISGGNEMQQGSVITLYDPAKLQVRTDVPLSDAAKVAIGTPVEITTEAVPNTTFKGVVSRVVHEANIQRNTVQFKVSIDNPSPLLKPEMLTRVRFYAKPREASDTPASVAETDGALASVLPASVLINRRGETAQVWLAETAGGAEAATARLCDVKLGSEVDGDIVITSGVNPGDRAIVEPPASLRPGARLRVMGEATAALTR